MKRRLLQTHELDYVLEHLKPLLKENKIEAARQMLNTGCLAEYGFDTMRHIVDWLYYALGPELYFKDSTVIYPNEFMEYSGVSFTIPSGIIFISHNAFSDSAIKTIVIPDTVEYIKTLAFANSNLQEITFENFSKVDVQSGAFEDSELQIMWVEDGVDDSKLDLYFDKLDDVQIVCHETGEVLRG